jgi:DeoR family transcriptional regulator, fructose operon transcriptional repressor
MLPTARRQAILAEVQAATTVSADALAARYAVSVETIRRDLRRLQAQGLLERVYGGATRPRAYEPPYETRRVQYLERKRAIGRMAASLVEPGDTLILDIGTSVAEVARALIPGYRGRVLTNSLLAAVELAGRDGVEVHTSGGGLRGGDLACSGPHAEAFFASYYADKAFLGSGGLHPVIGLTDYHPAEIASRRIILTHATQTYVLADSSKLGRVALAAVCRLDEVTAVITDDDAPPDLVRLFEREGVTVLVAPMAQPAERAG